jgi:hypothetical protein
MHWHSATAKQLKCSPAAGRDLELALVWADLHGRTDGVEFLTQKGVNPRARDQWNRPVA